MEPSMTNIIIIDDHPIVAQGISTILSQQGYKVLGVFSSSQEGFSSLLRLRPDVVIMDLCMPDHDGFEILKLLNSLNHRTKIIILTTSGEYADITRCAKLGANGYVLKSQLLAELLLALKAVIAGGHYFPSLDIPDVQSQPASNLTGPVNLTEKEKFILKQLTVGKRNKEIAQELNLSQKTISTHKIRICKKLGSLNLIEAIEQAKIKNILT